MKLSVVIPARNEEASIPRTLSGIIDGLRREEIDFEIVLVNDHSTDQTAEAAQQIADTESRVRVFTNIGRNGFGMAVRYGLQHATGDAIAIMMADGSDNVTDLVRYYRLLQQGYDCVFGSRFIRGARVVDYPIHKLLLNRAANSFIRCIFRIGFNDTTNAFKCYRRHVITAMQPLISPHFNLTVEMPLKAIVRGYSYAVQPISWHNRKDGVSKLKIKEMGSRYLFIILYLWLEKHLARGDYHRSTIEPQSQQAGAGRA